MSYWNIHEPAPGHYNFNELDWQLDLLGRHGCQASLCLGKRQPRWPECHMPDWGRELPKQEWLPALMRYIETTVRRYRHHPALHSWQLENEALLKSFGYCPDSDYDRGRLQAEYRLVKQLDPDHPVIMTLSDSWGLPWRRPTPDIYAMSLYRQTLNRRGASVESRRGPSFYRARAWLIKFLKRRDIFIHELQAEPWTAGPITETPLEEQLSLLPPERLEANIQFAVATKLHPIDLWGLEWWYWLRESHEYDGMWEAARESVQRYA
jgi:hypothetical protein